MSFEHTWFVVFVFVDMNKYDEMHSSCASEEEVFAGDHDDDDYDEGGDKLIENGYRSLLEVLVQPPGGVRKQLKIATNTIIQSATRTQAGVVGFFSL